MLQVPVLTELQAPPALPVPRALKAQPVQVRQAQPGRKALLALLVLPELAAMAQAVQPVLLEPQASAQLELPVPMVRQAP